MLGNLHPDEIEDMLYRHHIGHVACIAGDRPYVAPLTFAYDGASLAVRTGEGRMLEALRANPAVCIEIDEHTDPATWRSVVVDAVFEEAIDEATREAVRTLLAGVMPVVHGEDDPVVEARLRVTSRVGRTVTTERHSPVR